MALCTDVMYNTDAERAILGWLIQHGSERSRLFSFLTVRDFYDESHRSIFAAMQAMHASRKPIDLVTLNEAHPEFDVDNLIELIQCGFITTAQEMPYAEILRSARTRRDYAALAEKISEAARQNDFDAAKVSESIRLYLKGMDIGSSGEETTIKEELVTVLDQVFSGGDKSRGIMLNIAQLDSMSGGLKPGRMYVVGARPSVGKTVFGINAMLKAALAGKTVLYINREMEKTDMIKRMVANLSGIDMEKMEGGTATEEDYEAITDAITELNSLPIHICNRARTPAEIRAKAVELKDKQGLGLIVIDYLQRMSAGTKTRSRDEEVGAMSMAFKDMAMDLQVPVILLSQLSRSAANTRPNMAMLRESGNIEQDADEVVLLHAPDIDDVPPTRRDTYKWMQQNGMRYLEMIVDKNRHGRTGIFCMGFVGNKMRYVEVDGVR